MSARDTDLAALALDALHGDADALAILSDVVEERSASRGGLRNVGVRRYLQRLRRGDWQALAALIPVERLDISAARARALVGAIHAPYGLTRVVLIPHEGRWSATVGRHGGTFALAGSWATSAEAAEAARSIVRVMQLAHGRGEERAGVEVVRANEPRVNRDPRSFRELRQLARQAQRNPDALAVLQDALLETLPSYAKAIAEADERARSELHHGAWNVWFFPTRLNPVTRKHGTTNLAIELHRAFVERSDLNAFRSRQDAGQALVVYETTPTKYLVYQHVYGHGRGEVVDSRSGRVMGYRYSALPGHGPRWTRPGQSIDALNTAFLRWMRWQLMHSYTRDQLIDWLEWNDPNGSYSDEAAAREGQPPLTHAEAADLAFEHVAETKETLEEMRRNARSNERPL